MPLSRIRNQISKIFGAGYKAALMKGTGSGLLAQGLGFFLNLWAVAVCVHRLGSDYGFWLAASSLLTILQFMEIGLGPCIARLTTGFRVRNASQEEWSAFFSTAFWAYACCGCLIFIAGASAAPWIVKLMGGESGLQQHRVVVLTFAALQLAMEPLLGMFRPFIHGSQKLAHLGYLSLVESTVLALSTIFLVTVWKDIIVLPFAVLLSYSVICAVGYHWLPKEIKTAVCLFRLPDRKILKEIMTYCAPLLGAKICNGIKDRMDAPLVGKFLGPNAVIIYSVTQRLVQTVPMLLSGMFVTLAFAPLSEMIYGDKKARIREAVLEYFHILVLLTVGSAVVIWAINPVFVSKWVGGRFFGGDFLSLIFCSWIIIEILTRHMSGMILYAANKQKSIVYSQACEALLNFFFSILLVRYFGLAGIALGTTMAALLTVVWVMPGQALKYLEIAPKDILSTLSKKFILRLTLLTLCVIAARLLTAGSHWMIQLGAPVAAGGALGIYIALDKISKPASLKSLNAVKIS